jgi:hypothetical protein
MGPTSDAERIEDEASAEEFDQRLEDAVERSMNDFVVEETARESLRPRADDEPDGRPQPHERGSAAGGASIVRRRDTGGAFDPGEGFFSASPYS